MILKRLKEKLRDFFRHHNNIDWVLTVPALWDINARDMMREAAYMVYTISCIPYI